MNTPNRAVALRAVFGAVALLASYYAWNIAGITPWEWFAGISMGLTILALDRLASR